MICEHIGSFAERAPAERLRAEVARHVRRAGVRALMRDGGAGWGKLRYSVEVCRPGKPPRPPTEREFWQKVAEKHPENVVRLSEDWLRRRSKLNGGCW